MTEKQKKAIMVLNDLREYRDANKERLLSDEDYFALMDFVIGEHPQITYIPYTTPQEPITPYYQPSIDPLIPPYKFTCNTSQK